jgi:hypothetical protein
MIRPKAVWVRAAMAIGVASMLPPAASAAATTSGVDISFGRVVAALLLCLLLAVAIALLLRRQTTRTQLSFPQFLHSWDRRIEAGFTIVETRRMSLHGDISLVQWGDQEFLIACGAGGMLLLSQRPVDNHREDQPEPVVE